MAVLVKGMSADDSDIRSLVDVFAPKGTIVSASFQGDDIAAVLSGTSMATYMIPLDNLD
jgi:hypothetical protein